MSSSLNIYTHTHTHYTLLLLAFTTTLLITMLRRFPYFHTGSGPSYLATIIWAPTMPQKFKCWIITTHLWALQANHEVGNIKLHGVRVREPVKTLRRKKQEEKKEGGHGRLEARRTVFIFFPGKFLQSRRSRFFPSTSAPTPPPAHSRGLQVQA